jgi:hypothetical protein
LGIAAFLVGCDDGVLRELKRLPSPDGRVDAVLARYEGNATVGFVYKVYILPPGIEFDDEHPLLIADKTDGPDIAWAGEKKLIITYEEMRIFNFSNFWRSREVDDWHYEVDIDLVRIERR